MELRWVLLGLGLLVILGILLFGQGVLRRPTRPAARTERHREPTIEAPARDFSAEQKPNALLEKSDATVVPRKPSPRRPPDKVVALRIVPRDALPSGEKTVLALRALGMEHGQFGIFHKPGESDSEEPLFSIARLTEPGSFDLTNLADSEIPGLSVFLALPGAQIRSSDSMR